MFSKLENGHPLGIQEKICDNLTTSIITSAGA
jgi:hypothetical protein